MGNTFQYFKFQLKQKLAHPINTLFFILSPVIFYLISYGISKFIEIKEEPNAKYNITHVLFNFALNTFTIGQFPIVISDLLQEKIKFRKQYIFSYGFGLTKFYFVWYSIYLLLLIPSALVIVAIIYFMKILPYIDFFFMFCSVYSLFISNISIAIFCSVFSKKLILTSLVAIIFASGYFPFSYYIAVRFDQHNTSSNVCSGYILKYMVNANNNKQNIDYSSLFSKDIKVFFYFCLMLGGTITYILISIFCDIFYIPSHIKRSKKDKKDKDVYKEGYLHQIKLLPEFQDENENDTGFFRNIINLLKSVKSNQPNFYEMSIDEENSFSSDTKVKHSINTMSNNHEIANIDTNHSDISEKSIENNSVIENNDLEHIIEQNVALVEAIQVFKTYTTSKNVVLNNISAEVYNDEILAIVGEKESGKSTLMKMLYGRLSSSYGDIKINEKRMNYWKWVSISKNISVIPRDDFSLFSEITVNDLIKFYTLTRRTLHIRRRKHDREDGFKLLQELNFKGNLNDKIENLDPVEQNKVKTVIALIKNKPVMFLEEPTSGMTEEDRTHFWKVINARKHNRAILFSTESLEEASCYATSILYLEKGKSVVIGNKEEVLRELQEKLKT